MSRGSGHVVVATGFNREVATIRQGGVVVVAGGGDPVALRARIERAAAGAAAGLAAGAAVMAGQPHGAVSDPDVTDAPAVIDGGDLGPAAYALLVDYRAKLGWARDAVDNDADRASAVARQMLAAS